MCDDGLVYVSNLIGHAVLGIYRRPLIALTWATMCIVCPSERKKRQQARTAHPIILEDHGKALNRSMSNVWTEPRTQGHGGVQ